MLHTLEWHVETLPGSGIWTGSADHEKMTAIKGSSLLGGMRFWTEALLRSFGHRVCDCINDKEVFEKGKPENICAACHSFGCTGLSRAFSLHVTPENMTENKEKAILKVTTPGRDPAYYAFAAGWQGQLAFSMTCRRPLSWPRAEHWEKQHVILPPEVLLATFLMLEYGALGALDQYGCGLVRLLNRDALLPVVQTCPLPEDGGKKDSAPGFADLRDFFFFKGRLDLQQLERQSNCTVKPNVGQHVAPSHAAAVRVRRLLRDSLRGQKDDTPLRHWLCGKLKQESVGSHISLGVSGGTLYGWGWLPRTGIPDLSFSNGSAVRNTALHTVYACLKGICPELQWKEFDSARDTAAPKGWRQFVTEMIAQPWREA